MGRALGLTGGAAAAAMGPPLASARRDFFFFFLGGGSAAASLAPPFSASSRLSLSFLTLPGACSAAGAHCSRYCCRTCLAAFSRP